MRADLVALGVRLGWVAADEKEEPALATVRERLRDEGEGLLLIYDNAIDAESVRPYLPLGGLARVLVTSNAPHWRGIATPVEIAVWPKDIGADYLIARTGREKERAEAEACRKRSAACRSRTNRPRPIASGWTFRSPSTAAASKPRRPACSTLTRMRPGTITTSSRPRKRSPSRSTRRQSYIPPPSL